MTKKELCEMCTEYSADVKCENKETCKLQAILTENAQLKAENGKLKKITTTVGFLAVRGCRKKTKLCCVGLKVQP